MRSEEPGRVFARFVLVAAVLGVIAVFAPPPRYTDLPVIESVGRHPFSPDCAELHCFRVVVPWVMERMPGAVLVKWRVYAVLFNTAAAIALGRLSLLLGLSPRAARSTVWLSAFGIGALMTISNPYTADPVMFFLAPVVMMLLLRDRIRRAAIVAGAGIFVKEFAAAPLWIFAIYAWLESRRDLLARALTAAGGVTALWLAFHILLVTTGHAAYGDANPDNPTTRLFAGGYVRVWFGELGLRGALAAVFSTFGAVYLLIPAGLMLASRQLRRLALAALPAAAALVYVETPERALWNFFFLALPIAALALEQLPAAAASLFIVTNTVAGARIGAQVPFMPPSRYTLAVSLALAAVAMARVWRSPRVAEAGVS